ncbi:MAG: hypothetical protein J6X81_02190 [Muribaculaceae bacterium]|nr:hypothetical protein [Muribaculaceae bacterium]
MKKYFLNILWLSLIVLGACGGEDGPDPLRNIVVTRTLLSHVSDANGGTVKKVSVSDYKIVVNRAELYATIEAKVNTGAAAQDVRLRAAIDYDSERQWVAFKGNELSGYYDIFNDEFNLTYTIGSSKVIATKPTLFFTKTETVTDTVGSSYKYSGALYSFEIHPESLTADVAISDITLSKTTGRISQLKYLGLNVEFTPTGYKVKGEKIPLVPIAAVKTESAWDYDGLSWMDRFVNKNAVLKYELSHMDANLYITTSEMDASWSTPVYSSKATGSYY